MTNPRPWPTIAKRQRNEAADRVMDAIGYLTPLVQNGHEYTETERLRKLAQALTAATKAAMWLQQAGAPIVMVEG